MTGIRSGPCSQKSTSGGGRMLLLDKNSSEHTSLVQNTWQSIGWKAGIRMRHWYAILQLNTLIYSRNARFPYTSTNRSRRSICIDAVFITTIDSDNSITAEKFCSYVRCLYGLFSNSFLVLYG